MVLPQLDAYHSGRQMQHLQPWESVALAQSHSQRQEVKEFPLKYHFEAYADFHVVTLTVDGTPLLLFGDPAAMPQRTPWELCAAGDLGSMESNVMAGRALLGLFNLPDGSARCAIFIMLDKHMHGNNRSAASSAYRRIAPKSVELVLLPQYVALAFCVRLLEMHQKKAEYFNPHQDWPQPIAMNANFSIFLQKLAFLGDTRSRRELVVFAEPNPSRLPLVMGIAQAGVPVRRMASDRKTKLTDTLVRLLRHFLTPASTPLDSQYDQYFRARLLEPAAHGDGHILAVATALLLAIITGRSDLCIAGVFGAGKNPLTGGLAYRSELRIRGHVGGHLHQRKCSGQGPG